MGQVLLMNNVHLRRKETLLWSSTGLFVAELGFVVVKKMEPLNLIYLMKCVVVAMCLKVGGRRTLVVAFGQILIWMVYAMLQRISWKQSVFAISMVEGFAPKRK